MEIGNHMLFFEPTLGSFLEKLKNRWSRPFTMLQVFSSKDMELINNQGENFKVNGQMLYKDYRGKEDNLHHLAYLINTNT